MICSASSRARAWSRTLAAATGPAGAAAGSPRWAFDVVKPPMYLAMYVPARSATRKKEVTAGSSRVHDSATKTVRFTTSVRSTWTSASRSWWKKIGSLPRS
eukprot:7378237-Prymnesium_polylepis.1